MVWKLQEETRQHQNQLSAKAEKINVLHATVNSLQSDKQALLLR